MMKPPHRIRRQRWLLRASSSAEAFALRQRLRQEWETVLLPAFEAAFDELAPGDDIVRIPQIELRLKVAPGERLPEALAGLIRGQLGERLRELKSEPQTRRAAAVKTSSARQERFESLVRYLRTGSVRWDTAAHPDTMAAGMLEACRERQAELRSLLVNDHATPAFCFRLFQLLSVSEALALVRAILESVAGAWRRPLTELLVALLESGEARFGRPVQLELAAAILPFALAHRNRPEPPALDDLLEQGNVTASRRVTWAELARLAPGAESLCRKFRPAPAGQNAPAGWELSSDGVRPFGQIEHSHDPALPPKLPGSLPGPPETPIEEWRRRPEVPDDFPLLVGGAGLVLVHPFLVRFFETLGLKEPGRPELSSLTRAAALLHLLATGREAVFEYELPFVKVLLGLKPESPLCVAEGLITEIDREEADALLQAAIAHWPALKQTSPAGFRNSFLNRQGLLRDVENGWRLQVERTGFDVLLDQLPWGIGVVKLPWMERPLHTEW